jgi:hypothetical protein
MVQCAPEAEQWEYLLEFPEFRAEPVISERIFAESSGAPIEVSRKGKAPPLERGRGKAFPTCEPDRVTAEGILSEEIMGFRLQNLSLEEKSMGFTEDD